jgi:hypothetical protein
LRAAVRILGSFDQGQCQTSRRYDNALEQVLYQAKLLTRRLVAVKDAQSHGWIAARDQMRCQVTESLSQLKGAVADALGHCQPPPVLQPLLHDLYDDLLQLHQEFEDVLVDLKQGILWAVTSSITLDDVLLGPFRIELHFGRLTGSANVSAFDIVALDPHPPSSCEDVTHPHVRDNQLCAGDAAGPIAHALHEGRICDAFLAVNSVLHTYSGQSPYVSLNDWEGVPCADCGYSTNEDSRYYCDECGRDYCEECISQCDICQTTCCRGCLETDQESDRLCCKGCRRYCNSCNRMVDADSFEGDTELCPDCHELYLQELQENKQPLTEENSNEPSQDPITINPGPEASLVPDPA